MKKTIKSVLAQGLELDKHVIMENVPPSISIIDGGHLLHAVVWPTPLTYKSVVDLYIKHLISHYTQGRIIVVFDGSMAMKISRPPNQWSRVEGPWAKLL